MIVQFQPTKTVSVSTMAKVLGLSRQRFYQLIGSAFPHPLYDITTRRPFYPEDLQRTCRRVLKDGIGINGQPVLFNAPRNGRTKGRANGKHSLILDGVKSLGLTQATADQVKQAIKTCFPDGTGDLPQNEVIRTVFLWLNQQR